MKKKLAVITTHPIQYNAPFFRLLAKSNAVQPKIFYTWGDTVLQSKYDPGFDKTIEWDIPLLDGYEYEFLRNTAKDKGSHHFNGIVNPDITRTIEAWQPDAILVYGWSFNSHLKVIRHFKNKISVWFRGDSTLLDEKRNIKSAIKVPFLKWVYSHIDLTFYTGTENKKYFLKYGVKPGNLVKAPHAVDNDRFANTDDRYSLEAINFRKGLHISEDDIIFLFAGKLTAKKGVVTLLDAFSKMDSDNIHLVIAGNGPLEIDLKSKYSGYKKVTFLDFQNQQIMPILYCLCNVFVLPSDGPGESWGLAVNEAMAAGKPVIVSEKCGCATDLVVNGQNGFIVKAGNVADVYSKMRSMLEMKNDLVKMGDSSKATITKYNFFEFAQGIEKSISKND